MRYLTSHAGLFAKANRDPSKHLLMLLFHPARPRALGRPPLARGPRGKGPASGPESWENA